MVQLVVIDDETKIRSFLRALVTEQMEGFKVIGEAESVESGLQVIQELKPEAVLLDIEMRDGTGFDLLEELNSPPHIIFVTAYDHYAVKALRAGAVDYIEKPVNPIELAMALQKIKSRLQSNIAPAFEQLLQSVHSVTQGKVAIPTRTGLRYVNAQEIVRIESDGAYVKIFREHNPKPLTISRTLKNIQPLLDKLGFIRVHRSYLINVSKIKELHKTDGGYMIMSDGTQVPFSNQYKEEALHLIRKMTTLL